MAAVALIVMDVLTVPSGMSGEQGLHVGQRADRHADPAHLPAAWGASLS